MYHPPMTDLLIPLLIALVLVLMWRGPKTLPKLGEALGRGVREAKSEAAKAQDEIKARVGDADAPTGDSADPHA
jgi:Sec-independent protein translocase protein TatA